MGITLTQKRRRNGAGYWQSLFIALALTARHGAAAEAADLANAGDDTWALHGQLTNITQRHNHFDSPYSGQNSLTANGPTEETTDATLFAGMRIAQGTELWLNAEIDQGFGLNNTVGMAAFPSGGAYKIGADTPYLRLPRIFIRKTIGLGGKEEKVESVANQFGGNRAANNLVLTLGKFAVVDVFDTNAYAHDPRADFLNWAVIDAGAFDYAADSWGYTYGAALEWNQDWWTLRGGFFQLSPEPNAKINKIGFDKYSVVGEFEARHAWMEHPGKIKVTAFVNRAPMGSYDDALALAQAQGAAPDTALVRHTSSRTGLVFNIEQELSSDVGFFARASASDGAKETYEFTDIDRAFSAGLAIKGTPWHRPDDTVGIAAAVDQLSDPARRYFAAGGMGVLIGDGKLNYAPEEILEAYYAMKLQSHVTLTADYQRAVNPAYNQDRGPVSLYGLRLHIDY